MKNDYYSIHLSFWPFRKGESWIFSWFSSLFFHHHCVAQIRNMDALDESQPHDQRFDTVFNEMTYAFFIFFFRKSTFQRNWILQLFKLVGFFLWQLCETMRHQLNVPFFFFCIVFATENMLFALVDATPELLKNSFSRRPQGKKRQRTMAQKHEWRMKFYALWIKQI